MLKWLRNKSVASSLGFLILMGLVWLIGPYVGFPSEQTRLLIIVGILLLWVMLLLLGRIVSERGGRLLDKMLRRQADDAVIGASAEQRREVAQIRQRLLAAIDTINTSQLGKRAGKAALYELPWYMVIGHPAAGKSTAICYSGLNFPYGDKQPVPGVGGTRNCDWFFTSEGVLLDTAGRYSTVRDDRAEWLEFLKLLKKHRAKAPVNGIVVALSHTELTSRGSEQASIYARQVRERIDEIDSAFGVNVPVYLVVTKMDLVGGFSEFFEDLSPEERQAAWGGTLSHDQGEGFDAARVVGQQFDVLHRGLVQMGFDKLANNRGNVRRPALFAFPIEFNSLREPLCRFVELLFQHDPYHSKPLLRGFYFTSAVQEGAPKIVAGARVSRVFDLAEKSASSAPPAKSECFFLLSLFRDVMFPDCHLVSRQTRPAAGRFRLAGMAAGLCGLALLSGLLTWSFIGNQKLVATAQEELVAARQLAQSEELSDRLKALQVIQLRVEQLYQYRQEGHPFKLGMGLYQGDEIEQALRREYFAGVRELMLVPVKASLEGALAGLSRPATSPIPAAPAEQPVPKAKPTPPKQGDGDLPYIPIGYSRPGGMSAAAAADALLRREDRQSVGVIRAQMDLPLPRRDRGAASVPGGLPSGTARLEDSYNALKTYLMLKQKERMEVSHLSDQIPKYWRPWLSANRGKGNPDEINRMAERVVAFYLSQIGEHDLPLIDNREDLVGMSREVLRGSFRQLSAVERVYNELKARANTQFAPMTVGRILNSRDLDLVAGSTTLAGAFTREAWDKYFRAAIGDASRGAIKGDDWVLATTSLDNLGKDGNTERNRAALETLYKEEYAREWKKFLQGVAIQDFRTLDNVAQSLGKLSDTQNSAMRQILVAAAHETSWDNPSQISKTIETAKSSVIERTEKLILGSGSATPVQPDKRYGELGGKFAALQAITLAGEGGRMPLSSYLDMLGKLKVRMAQIAANPDPGGAARQLMQATLSSGSSEFSEALSMVDSVLLATAQDDAKEAVRPLLVRPLIQAYATLIPVVEQEINRNWRNEVMTSWRSLAGKYPFSDSANEAPMAEIAKFLKPAEGTLAKFVEKNLNGLVTKRGEQLVPRTWANLGVGFSPAFLSGVVSLSAAGNSVLQEGDSAKFELQPVPTPGLSEIVIEVDGQVLRYRNGPQPWTGFSWPNIQASVQGARLQVVSFSGMSTSVANFGGRLGLMRLLSQARVEERGNGNAVLEWRVDTRSRRDSMAGDSEAVRFNFRVVSGANPLSLSGLRRLSLPEKITIRGN